MKNLIYINSGNSLQRVSKMPLRNFFGGRAGLLGLRYWPENDQGFSPW
jgi:hypothetical protein